MTIRSDNSIFGHIIAPLMTPMFVLQMGRSKSWSRKARIKHLKVFAEACHEAMNRADKEIIMLKREEENLF